MRIWKAALICRTAAAFALNWFWEVGQMFAFELQTPHNPIEVFAFCSLAAVIDALVTIGIYAVLTRFYSDNRAIFYFFAAASGALCAVFFERLAFALGWWNYNELMPIVPLLKVGLLPFMQLTMLVPLAIWLTGKFRGV